MAIINYMFLIWTMHDHAAFHSADGPFAPRSELPEGKFFSNGSTATPNGWMIPVVAVLVPFFLYAI